MRVFAATVVILSVMILCIGVNRSFILDVADSLSEHLDIISASENKLGDIRVAEEYWKEVRFRTSLSVSHGIVEEIDKRFIGLRSFTEEGREPDFKCELLLFRDDIKKMSRLEKIFK